MGKAPRVDVSRMRAIIDSVMASGFNGTTPRFSERRLDIFSHTHLPRARCYFCYYEIKLERPRGKERLDRDKQLFSRLCGGSSEDTYAM